MLYEKLWVKLIEAHYCIEELAFLLDILSEVQQSADLTFIYFTRQSCQKRKCERTMKLGDGREYNYQLLWSSILFI